MRGSGRRDGTAEGYAGACRAIDTRALLPRERSLEPHGRHSQHSRQYRSYRLLPLITDTWALLPREHKLERHQVEPLAHLH